MNHVMVDLETLGTTADSVIISLGAVKFDLETGKIADEGFYRSISVESNLDWKRHISEDTLMWWFKQEPGAQKVFFEAKETLETALVEFAEWVQAIKGDPVLWSNGADFDIPMLAHAYTQMAIEVPWKFWNTKCFRTYKGLPGARDVKVERIGTHHNALADAYFQAQMTTAIHAALFQRKTNKAIA